MQFEYDNENLMMALELYKNKRIAIQLTCETGEPYSVLTTNIVDAVLADDEVCISDWNHPADLLEVVLASGRFEDTLAKRRTGFVDAPVWRIKCPELLAEIARLRS
ncbi:hypothetical protein [Pseudomonas sp. MWU12-2323]|uniref:hypothetical protein n=1 Tax=Pseudomonas sp. MWU12-2323 TaxID=2651296 RepID=UPI00128D8149|nr:hypothetical protein [Pseudomonas sp. MWU12-2323]MPQ69492.1 hypothetical protein [Pseudomonas sp. MWU12-2323]